jgi:uncharacterized membrane protein YkoI
MLRRNLLALATSFAVAAVLTTGCASNGKDDDGEGTSEQTITADQVPAAVSQAFQRAHPGATVMKVEKETYKDGTVHYEYEFKGADGKEQEVEFNASGEQLDEH